MYNVPLINLIFSSELKGEFRPSKTALLTYAKASVALVATSFRCTVSVYTDKRGFLGTVGCKT